MTATLAPALLIPTGDPTPVEKAVVDGILDDFEPETFLWIVFHRPDGGAHVWHAWTAGGHPLGDSIDQAAIAAGYDAADWLHITGRHRTDHHRGRVEIQAHPLRPIEADVHNGLRDSGTTRDWVCRFLATAAGMAGQRRPADAPVPRWTGVGPALLTRK
jgi:hypothetical protein